MSEAEPESAVPKPKGRWFQFSLRRLMKVFAHLAILFALASALAIMIIRVENWMTRQHEAAWAIEKLGGSVRWSQPSGPAWLHTLLWGCFL